MKGSADPGLRAQMPRAGEHVQLQITGVLAQLRRRAWGYIRPSPLEKRARISLKTWYKAVKRLRCTAR